MLLTRKEQLCYNISVRRNSLQSIHSYLLLNNFLSFRPPEIASDQT